MTTTTNHALAFDIGGTHIRASLVNMKTGQAVNRLDALTPNHLTHNLPADAILELTLSEIRRLGDSLLTSKTPPELVSVGYPGPVDRNGVAIRSPTILGEQLDRSFNIQERLSEIWKPVPVYVLNDLTAAGYYFVACGETEFCVVTVGSGIGNKVFVDSKPVTGTRQLGGEIGHLKIPQFDDELGSVASGRAAEMLCAENGERYPSHVSELVRGFAENEPVSTEVITRLSHPLGWTLASIHLACGIEKFFIIGGFAKALGEKYRQTLLAHVRSLVWDVGQDWDNFIELGPQGVDEGIVGGVYYAAHNGFGGN